MLAEKTVNTEGEAIYSVSTAEGTAEPEYSLPRGPDSKRRLLPSCPSVVASAVNQGPGICCIVMRPVLTRAVLCLPRRWYGEKGRYGEAVGSPPGHSLLKSTKERVPSLMAAADQSGVLLSSLPFELVDKPRFPPRPSQ